MRKQNAAWFPSKHYSTRLDRFRQTENISLPKWAEAAGMATTQLQRYRSARYMPRTDTAAALVRGAAQLLGRKVRVSELFDVGEDEPVARHSVSLGRSRAAKAYDTPIDQLLRSYNIPPAAFAREAGVSRQELSRIRANRATMKIASLAKLIRTFRRLGHAVVAEGLMNV